VRVLITGQPASGLFILADLLRRAYALEDLNTVLDAIPKDVSALTAMIDGDGFPECALLAWHYAADDALIAACKKRAVQVICVARDPYITFETVFLHANTDRGMPAVPQSSLLKGADLESEEVAAFIAKTYAEHLALTEGWQRSAAALMIRQEELVIDPEQVLGVVSMTLGEIDRQRASQVIAETTGNHALGSAGNSLSDSRLPVGVNCELNKVIPDAFTALGYKSRPCDPAEVMNRRVQDFACFLDTYTENQRVFLVGHGKSGTTWLHMLFFHHPNAAVVAERRLFEHPDENEALFDQLLNDEWFTSWFRSSSFGVTAPEQSGVRYELSRLMSDYLLYRALAVRKTAKGFERKTPITHFSEKIALNTEQDAQVTIGTLSRLYPDAKIVHIVRDPRDVAVSAMFHSYRNFREKHEKNWVTDFVESVLEGRTGNILKKQAVAAYFKSHAKAWNQIARIFHTSGQALYGDNYLLVRYEDLLQMPEQQVARLFSFSGLADTPELVAAVVEKASFKNLSKGRKAGEQDSSSFYRKGVSGDWKNYLSDDASRKVFRDAWDLMVQFGYE
jgi:hypothetical protein